MRRIKVADLDEMSGLANEGWHHVEVSSCDEKQSRSGDDFYTLKLVDARTGSIVCYDNAMLGGRGVGIGLRKLQALGAATLDTASEEWVVKGPAQVVGLCAYVYVRHEDYEREGQRRKRCQATITEGDAGYRPESDPPEGFHAGRPF